MHKKSMDALTGQTAQSTTAPAPSASGCPVPHASRSEEPAPKSLLSQLNPLNYMFPDLSQKPAANQNYDLPTSREPSTIPKGSGDGNWEYPSPQQMYNALLRKGHTDTDVTAVEAMVSVHNFLNEGAWDEIMGWEKRFAKGLYHGYQVCKRGEAHAAEEMDRNYDGVEVEPSLMRFQGRPKDLTPKATMLQVLGWVYPAKYGYVHDVLRYRTYVANFRSTDLPFDRHDWYVSRKVNGEERLVRYVIDYYSGEPEADGEPVFYLDVRPAATPQGAAERIIRWSTDVWWKGMGGDRREQESAPFFKQNAGKIWGSAS